MKLNQKLIEQLRNGEIAVENSGTVEQLKEVLKAAFPKDKLPPGGTMKYYKMDRDFIDRWNATDSTTLPTISVSDFYKLEPQPLHYNVEGAVYSLDYQDLKSKYQAVVNYSDEVFMDNLPEIAHLACIISYFKGLGNSATISDKGIIHELIHLMTDPEEPTNDLSEIREKFNKLIQLV